MALYELEHADSWLVSYAISYRSQCTRAFDTEQLDGMERELEVQNAHMRSAEKTMTEMEMCCGCCLCPCSWRRSYGKCRAKAVSEWGHTLWGCGQT